MNSSNSAISSTRTGGLSEPRPSNVGHCARDYDLPVLRCRGALVHQLGLPWIIKQDRWESNIDSFISASKSSGQFGKLDDYAFGMNVEGKTSHGSDVQPTYNKILAGDTSLWEDIVSYCEYDTELVSTFIDRFTKKYTE